MIVPFLEVSLYLASHWWGKSPTLPALSKEKDGSSVAVEIQLKHGSRAFRSLYPIC